MDGIYHRIERLLFGQEPRGSVPIKKQGSTIRLLVPNNSRTSKITSREITALVVAACAQGVSFAPGASIQRVFRFSNQTWAIENGCGQDIVHSGAADLVSDGNPLYDRFVLRHPAIGSLTDSAIMSAWRSAQRD